MTIDRRVSVYSLVIAALRQLGQVDGEGLSVLGGVGALRASSSVWLAIVVLVVVIGVAGRYSSRLHLGALGRP